MPTTMVNDEGFAAPFTPDEVGEPFPGTRGACPEDGRWHLDTTTGIYHCYDEGLLLVWGPEAPGVIGSFPRDSLTLPHEER